MNDLEKKYPISITEIENAAVAAYRHQHKIYLLANRLVGAYERVIATALKEHGENSLYIGRAEIPEEFKCEIEDIRLNGNGICDGSVSSFFWDVACIYFTPMGRTDYDSSKGIKYDEPFDCLFEKILGAVKYIYKADRLKYEDELARRRNSYKKCCSDCSREEKLEDLVHEYLVNYLKNTAEKAFVLPKPLIFEDYQSPVYGQYDYITLTKISLSDEDELIGALERSPQRLLDESPINIPFEEKISIKTDRLITESGNSFYFSRSNDGSPIVFLRLGDLYSKYGPTLRRIINEHDPIRFDNQPFSLPVLIYSIIPIDYTLRESGDVFSFYRNEIKITTPLGSPLETSNRELAERILTALKKYGNDFTSNSILPLHGAYLDLMNKKDDAPLSYDEDKIISNIKSPDYLHEEVPTIEFFEPRNWWNGNYGSRFGMLGSPQFMENMKKFADALTPNQIFVEAFIQDYGTDSILSSFCFYAGLDSNPEIEDLAGEDGIESGALDFINNLKFYFHLENI